MPTKEVGETEAVKNSSNTADGDPLSPPGLARSPNSILHTFGDEHKQLVKSLVHDASTDVIDRVDRMQFFFLWTMLGVVIILAAGVVLIVFLSIPEMQKNVAALVGANWAWLLSTGALGFLFYLVKTGSNSTNDRIDSKFNSTNDRIDSKFNEVKRLYLINQREHDLVAAVLARAPGSRYGATDPG